MQYKAPCTDKVIKFPKQREVFPEARKLCWKRQSLLLKLSDQTNGHPSSSHRDGNYAFRTNLLMEC